METNITLSKEELNEYSRHVANGTIFIKHAGGFLLFPPTDIKVFEDFLKNNYKDIVKGKSPE